MESKKEAILNQVETILKNIKRTNTFDNINYFSNDVGYVDRQYINITEDDILNKPNNWIILNNEGEEFSALPGGNFENKIKIQIVCFTKANEDSPNLDSIMNSLQRDIFLGIIKDETLGRLCDYVLPILIETVDDMIYPYGGFVFSMEITYAFNKSNI